MNSYNQKKSKNDSKPYQILKLYYPRLDTAETDKPRNYGFSLTAIGNTIYFFSSDQEERDDWVKSLKEHPKIILKYLQNTYSIGKQIGEGNFAKVRILTNKTTSECYAVKSVSKKRIQGNYINIVFFIIRNYRNHW